MIPRYFFNSADGGRDIDDTGTEFVDIAAARAAAIRYAGDIMSDQPDSLCHGRDFRVDVTDQGGVPLFAIINRAEDAPKSGGSA